MLSIEVSQTWSPKEIRQLAAIGAGRWPTSSPGRELATTSVQNSLAGFLKAKGFRLESIIRANITKRGAGGGDWKPLSEDYAKRKAQGKTKGGAKYGSPAMLRDSGDSVEEIQAVVVGTTLTLNVPELQAMHWTGGKKLPARSPFNLNDQRIWNDEFARDLERFLDGELTIARAA
jgi:hypothetical protein